MIDVCKLKRTKNHKDRGISQMQNRANQRLEEITAGMLIVGVDVAKSVQWARFVDYRGVEVGKAVLFQNNRQGFERIVTRMQEIRNIETLRNPGCIVYCYYSGGRYKVLPVVTVGRILF